MCPQTYVFSVIYLRNLIISMFLNGFIWIYNIAASNAKDILNFTHVDGKPIRIMFSQRDPSLRKSGYANLFIKNLDHSVDDKALYEIFSAFGSVLSCKVAVDKNEKPKGYGFVQFDNDEAAQNAIKRLNGMLINEKQVYVGTFMRRQERDRAKGSPKFTNVYVKNLSESTTDENLRKMFDTFGPITSAVVMKDGNGKSRCFGFVNFENFDSAAAAVENLNGTSLDDKVLYVGKAEKKAEREAELKAKFEQERNSRLEKLKGTNLYLKNLDDSINDEKLKEMFSEFGTVTSCKVILLKSLVTVMSILCFKIIDIIGWLFMSSVKTIYYILNFCCFV